MERQEGFICCEHLRPCLKDVPAETILCTCPWHTQHKLLWCNSTGTLYHDGNLVAPKYDQVPHYWNIKGAHTNRTLRTVAAIHDLPQNVKDVCELDLVTFHQPRSILLPEYYPRLNQVLKLYASGPICDLVLHKGEHELPPFFVQTACCDGQFLNSRNDDIRKLALAVSGKWGAISDAFCHPQHPAESPRDKLQRAGVLGDLDTLWKFVKTCSPLIQWPATWEYNSYEVDEAVRTCGYIAETWVHPDHSDQQLQALSGDQRAMLAFNGVEGYLYCINALLLATHPGHHAGKLFGMGFCATARMVLFVHDCLLRRRRVAVNDTDIHLGNAILEALPQLALNFPHLNLGEYIIITDICRMDLCDGGWMELVEVEDERLRRITAILDLAGVMGARSGNPPRSPKHGLVVYMVLQMLLLSRNLYFGKCHMPDLIRGNVASLWSIGGDADIRDIVYSREVGGTTAEALRYNHRVVRAGGHRQFINLCGGYTDDALADYVGLIPSELTMDDLTTIPPFYQAVKKEDWDSCRLPSSTVLDRLVVVAEDMVQKTYGEGCLRVAELLKQAARARMDEPRREALRTALEGLYAEVSTARRRAGARHTQCSIEDRHVEGRLVELKSQVNDIKNLALKQQLQQRLAALKADFQAGDGGDAVVWQLLKAMCDHVVTEAASLQHAMQTAVHQQLPQVPLPPPLAPPQPPPLAAAAAAAGEDEEDEWEAQFRDQSELPVPRRGGAAAGGQQGPRNPQQLQKSARQHKEKRQAAAQQRYKLQQQGRGGHAAAAAGDGGAGKRGLSKEQDADAQAKERAAAGPRREDTGAVGDGDGDAGFNPGVPAFDPDGAAPGAGGAGGAGGGMGGLAGLGFLGFLGNDPGLSIGTAAAVAMGGLHMQASTMSVDEQAVPPQGPGPAGPAAAAVAAGVAAALPAAAAAVQAAAVPAEQPAVAGAAVAQPAAVAADLATGQAPLAAADGGAADPLAEQAAQPAVAAAAAGGGGGAAAGGGVVAVAAAAAAAAGHPAAPLLDMDVAQAMSTAAEVAAQQVLGGTWGLSQLTETCIQQLRTLLDSGNTVWAGSSAPGHLAASQGGGSNMALNQQRQTERAAMRLAVLAGTACQGGVAEAACDRAGLDQPGGRQLVVMALAAAVAALHSVL